MAIAFESAATAAVQRNRMRSRRALPLLFLPALVCAGLLLLSSAGLAQAQVQQQPPQQAPQESAHASAQSAAAPAAAVPAAAAPSPSAAAAASAARAVESRGPVDADAPLRVWNREVFVFRVPMFGLSPRQRADRASDRIAGLPTERLHSQVQANRFEYEGLPGYAVMIEGETLFSVFEADTEPDDPPLPQVAARAAEVLQKALRARAEQSDWRLIASAVAWTVGATVVMLLALHLLRTFARRIAILTRALRLRTGKNEIFDWRRVLVTTGIYAIRWTRFALSAIVVYIWLAFVLTRFPYTHPWGETLGESLFKLVSRLLVDLLHALPDLATVAAIFLIAHLVVRGLHGLFNAAHASGAALAALQTDTIGATRRLTAVLIWVFALVMAYPYIPGSSSDAFKGLSVFFGVLVTLGSSGVVSQVLAGFVLIYSRALRAGDFVQVGDSEGYVIELGTLSTKLRNRLDQQVTLPNSVVVTARVINLSSTSKSGGISLSTSVTIGYDAPWRQVQAMLTMAAGRTAELLAEPAPVVRQIALQDYYTEYELNVFMRAGAAKYDVLNLLHGHIQDVFNEFGVQIMSPHYVLQPKDPVLVPKEGWRPPPVV